MGILDELSFDQKHAISEIMDGTISLIENITYSSSKTKTIAAAVVAFIEENDFYSVDEVIEELGRYKGDNNG